MNKKGLEVSKDPSKDEQSKITNQSKSFSKKNDVIENNNKENSSKSSFIKIDEKACKYFENKMDNEEYPVKIEEYTNIRYYNLEIIFNTFYPIDSLSKAKNISKKERESKNIEDTSFTYGEIVHLYFITFIRILELWDIYLNI